MKVAKFKNPDSILVVPGFGTVNIDNLTIEKYETLIKLNPAHADLFIIEEAEEKVAAEKVKSFNKKSNADI